MIEKVPSDFQFRIIQEKWEGSDNSFFDPKDHSTYPALP